MHVIVVGAGIIGVTTAYALAERGCSVDVLEAANGCAQGTSFANGGQLSFSHAEPWANPSTLPLLLKSWRRDAVINVPPTMAPDVWKWGLDFLRNSRRSRVQQSSAILYQLAISSRSSLLDINRRLGFSYGFTDRGTLHPFYSQRVLETATEHATWQKKVLACDFSLLNSEELIAKESSLNSVKNHLCGGLYYPNDASGDALQFTEQLADYLRNTGKVKFYFGETVSQIQPKPNGVNVITLFDEFRADTCVIAAGYRTPALLKKLGFDVPILPMKGYSLTIAIDDNNEEMVPHMALTDCAEKVVYSRLGNRLRVAGMAEIGNRSTEIDPIRVERLKKAVHRLFPALPLDDAIPWTGIRPATANGIPLVDKTPLDNVYINAGHGTLGWTLSMGSAVRVAEIMLGNKIRTTEFEAMRVRA